MAQGISDLLTLENSVFRSYLFYCSILVLKMMFLSVFTGLTRFRTMSFANPEDATGIHSKYVGIGKVKVDDRVERARRAHLNDLENIPIFFVAAFAYLLTNPSAYFAKTLFQTFTVVRSFHTLVYAVIVIPQPARVLTWFIGYAITGYMAVISAFYYLI